MTEELMRSYEATVDDVSPASRSITSKINTGSLDKYRTVIDPVGIDLKEYEPNPVVLWEHGLDPTRGRVPMGKNLWLNRRSAGNGTLVAKTQFAKDDYSQNLFEMYKDGILRGWSVYVRPDTRRCSPPTKDELRSRPELESCLMMYRGSTLKEYSGVVFPANTDALTLMEARGIWFPAEARSAASEAAPEPEPAAADAPALPPLEGRRFEDIHRELAAEIRSYYDRQRELMTAMSDLIRGKV